MQMIWCCCLWWSLGYSYQCLQIVVGQGFSNRRGQRVGDFVCLDNKMLGDFPLFSITQCNFRFVASLINVVELESSCTVEYRGIAVNAHDKHGAGVRMGRQVQLTVSVTQISITLDQGSVIAATSSWIKPGALWTGATINHIILIALQPPATGNGTGHSYTASVSRTVVGTVVGAINCQCRGKDGREEKENGGFNWKKGNFEQEKSILFLLVAFLPFMVLCRCEQSWLKGVSTLNPQ